jgi:hypothetical protein
VTEADRLRALWRQHFDEFYRICAENDARHERFMDSHAAGRRPVYEGTLPPPPFPAELRGLRCGAKNRRGQPCKQSSLGRNARCKFHGGMSTGPKTPEGKARARANLALRHGDKGSNRAEPHEVLTNVDIADLPKPDIAPEAATIFPEPHADLGKPQVQGVGGDSSGGMAESEILASIAAIAAKRRARG